MSTKEYFSTKAINERANARDLTPYERFQLETYGNILRHDTGTDETPEPDDRRGSAEEAHIFKSENPE